MSILGFEYFLVAAEEMNFTKAAARLYISQQSLSAHIQRLEEQYGVTLFERKPSLKLTLAGEAMMFYAKQMLKAEESMTAQFADITKECRGHIKLGMSRQRAQIFFNNIWDKYHSNNENISVSIIERNTDILIQQLRSNLIDLCTGINVVPTKDIEITSLFTEKICCSISTNLLKKYRPNSWEQDQANFAKNGVDLLTIRDLPFLMLPAQNRIRTIADRMFASHGAYPHVILETNNQELMLKLADSGVGIISPMYLYDHWQNSPISLGAPQIFPINSPLFASNVCIVTRKNEPLPSYAESMKDIITKEFLNYKNTINKLNPYHLID